MKKIIIGVVGAAMALTGLVVTPAYAVDCPKGSARESANSFAECNLASTSTNLWDSVNAIINTIIAVLGITTVIVIILGGVTYVLSQGDAGKIKKAKDTILYGVIGLIIAMLSYAVVNFVLGEIFEDTGSDSGGTSTSTGTGTGATTVTSGDSSSGGDTSGGD